jgi:hypothetical protein
VKVPLRQVLIEFNLEKAAIHEAHEETPRKTHCLQQKSNHLLGE